MLQALNKETPGDKFSIYGSAARSAYVNEVYNKVSYDTSLQIQEASINSYDKNTGLPNRNPDDLKRQINDIVQKNTAALSKVSVVAGTKLGAQLSVQGLDGYQVYLLRNTIRIFRQNSLPCLSLARLKWTSKKITFSLFPNVFLIFFLFYNV